MPLLPALAFARQLIEGRLKNGGRALDGTAGNGRDTLFLAQLAGGSGKVWAFDIQAQALSNTTGLLRENGVEGQVELIAASHADLADYVREPLDAAMFNFGYLPGGDKTVTTTADSSVRAMQAAAALLAEGGLLTAVVYSGHPAGRAEAAAIKQWVAALPQEQYQVLHYRFTNQRNHPPQLLAIEKRIRKPNR
ncbi:class I SAM-dependent methyltransferase [Neisseria elongata]|uniref:tRNA (mnm(5)s(2)U34)-methyltransferase n=1 Tax=Neisseria elongata TaxID=495 RepID=UPI002852DDD3|nr:class I SAM-dependent methyltransferase [Neisseria elongata]